MHLLITVIREEKYKTLGLQATTWQENTGLPTKLLDTCSKLDVELFCRFAQQTCLYLLLLLLLFPTLAFTFLLQFPWLITANNEQ